jgi:hypothetical protein
MTTSYDKCKSKKINNILKEFEHGMLKTRGDHKVKNRNQALAIALNVSKKACKDKVSSKDIVIIENRVNKQLYKNNKIRIDSKKIPTSTIVQSELLYDYYKNKKQYAKARRIKNDIMLRTLYSLRDPENYNKNIINSVINFIK